ncbi:pyrroline-5-carboxylate reductase [Lachnoclostridium phytofermentans]|uniref:Pyrroline-5-carboxylate reductase n=1 Tax=Lachnoclostridium phytofermentans (strain ATCC 700394 / DSM 18823 / ISDg) TaxID=357809 RepID=A9KPJ8_LACP7|nr:pyrroline-5-carboxylate reductase [Lachnoclostridium phytofermentans]ABX43272.1 pyrroline-5-carboxylate reductase [Lachnoclostridium phytofermentans ISDg]
MLENITIGFIGFGNMAQALANGLLFKNVVKPRQIYASAKNYEKLCKNTREKGMIPCKSANELVEQCDIIIIAVKPFMVPEVITPIKELLQKKIVISVAAGYPFDKYEAILVPGTHHLSTIPNTPVSIGEGIIICENHHSLTKEEYDTVADLFSKIALLEFVDTKQLTVAGTLSGCGPAFVSMFLEALADGAVKHGLPRDTSYRLASQMVAGTGKLQIETGAHPGAMKDAVCSPGGTTIVGVATLERKGLRSAVIEAIDEIEKSRK